MSLTDKTYYVLDINIPDSQYNDLQAVIDRYEKPILVQLLGYELYKEVTAYSVTSEQRIKDIVEGKEYTDSSGNLTKWEGLTNARKESLIAYYVYYYYLKNHASSLQTTGVMAAKNENAVQVTGAIKAAAAWTRLNELYYEAYSFLSQHESEYPEWDFTALGNVNTFDL